jgi:4-hydroxybenzoate polyprenyltransferase
MNTEIDNNKAEADKKMWQTARWGVIIICVVHLFVSLIALGAGGAEASSAGRFTAFPILINFWIASWYVKDRIEKGKEEQNLFLMGVKAAGVVFLVQVVLGAILISILMK